MAQTIKIRRTLTPDTPPTSLEHGELAAGLADVPIRMWIGTPTGVKELFAGTAVEDAPNDAVYGRCNGEWEQVPIVSATAPANPAPNSLWWDTVSGRLFLWYNDGTSLQWVAMPSEVGPQGAQGPQGEQGPIGGAFPDVPTTDGAHLRRHGAWIPMTHASTVLGAAVAMPAASTFYNGPSVNVGNEGTWFVTGTISVAHPTGIAAFVARLWDGSTIASEATGVSGGGTYTIALSVSGIFTNPVAAIRISGACSTAGANIVVADRPANFPGSTRQSHINAVRIG
jgi:hypothetical protein